MILLIPYEWYLDDLLFRGAIFMQINPSSAPKNSGGGFILYGKWAGHGMRPRPGVGAERGFDSHTVHSLNL